MKLCQHAGCTNPATVKTRFGDGTYRVGVTSRDVHWQTYVHYCDTHHRHVAGLFHLCHTRFEDGPNGPSRIAA